MLSLKMLCLSHAFAIIYRTRILLKIFLKQTKTNLSCIELFNRQNCFKSALLCFILLCTFKKITEDGNFKRNLPLLCVPTEKKQNLL